MLDILPVKGVKALTYMTTCPDKQLVLSLLCSQINTVHPMNLQDLFLAEIQSRH